jgi:hypothetical protein
MPVFARLARKMLLAQGVKRRFIDASEQFLAEHMQNNARLAQGRTSWRTSTHRCIRAGFRCTSRSRPGMCRGKVGGVDIAACSHGVRFIRQFDGTEE